MIRVVFTTFSSEEVAAQIVRTLVEERLAACGTIIPKVRSIYAWEGLVEDSTEVMVVFKTGTERLASFEKRLLELHPYEVPELIALTPEAVSADYAAWVLGITAFTPPGIRLPNGPSDIAEA